jgi:hypothetical protein
LLIQPVSRLLPGAIVWLWPGRLALGTLAILDGDPGLGKSLLALDLCACLSTGRPLPDGAPVPGPVSVIVLNGEDGANDVIRPRLHGLGADLERVFTPQPPPGAGWQAIHFPAHTEALGRALAQTGARLVVIDPVMAFLDPGVITGSDQSVRQALYPLACLAAEYRCVILLIRHLNKGRSFRSLYRGGGSIGIVGACRSAWLVARDPQDPARRVLAQVKNNLAGPQPGLAFTVGAGPAAPAVLSWLGPCSWTADQLLAAAAAAPPRVPARDRAREFLAEALADGPRTSRELWALGQERWLTRRTLRRAKQDLHVRSLRVWAGGQRLSYWLLPGQQLPAGLPPEAAVPDLEEWLAPLREQFPPATPLDDL